MARIRVKDGLSYGGSSQIQADEIDKSGGFLSFCDLRAAEPRTRSRRRSRKRSRARSAEDFSAQELADAKSGWMQSRSVGRSQDKELVRGMARRALFDRTYAWDADLEKQRAGARCADHPRRTREVHRAREVHYREGRRLREGCDLTAHACAAAAGVEVGTKKSGASFAGAADSLSVDSRLFGLRSGDRRRHHQNCHAERCDRAPALHSPSADDRRSPCHRAPAWRA